MTSLNADSAFQFVYTLQPGLSIPYFRSFGVFCMLTSFFDTNKSRAIPAVHTNFRPDVPNNVCALLYIRVYIPISGVSLMT